MVGAYLRGIAGAKQPSSPRSGSTKNRHVLPSVRATTATLAAFACVAAIVSWTAAAGRAAPRDSVHVLHGAERVRFSQYDWWCGLVPVVSTAGARSTAPECGPFDSGAVGTFMDWAPDPADLSLRLPLQIYAYRRPRFMGRANGARIYQFSFAVRDRPKGPTTTHLVAVGTSIGFRGSSWACQSARAALTCAETKGGRPQLPIITVRAKQRAMQVKTSAAPILLSGNGGAATPFLYRVDR